MTSFFAVHLVLTIVSLTLGTIIGAFGIRALLRLRRRDQSLGSAPDGDRELSVPLR